MNRDIEMAKKHSVLTLEFSPDIKTNVIASDLTKFTNQVKKLSARKKLVIIVFEL